MIWLIWSFIWSYLHRYMQHMGLIDLSKVPFFRAVCTHDCFIVLHCAAPLHHDTLHYFLSPYRDNQLLHERDERCLMRGFKFVDGNFWLVAGCWSFMSWQHLRSYQDGCQLVTVNTHGDFIVLLHSETGPQRLDIPISHNILTLGQPVHALTMKRQLSVFESVIWLGQNCNPWIRIPQSTQMWDGCSTPPAIFGIGHFLPFS